MRLKFANSPGAIAMSKSPLSSTNFAILFSVNLCAEPLASIKASSAKLVRASPVKNLAITLYLNHQITSNLLVFFF